MKNCKVCDRLLDADFVCDQTDHKFEFYPLNRSHRITNTIYIIWYYENTQIQTIAHTYDYDNFDEQPHYIFKKENWFYPKSIEEIQNYLLLK